MAIQTRTTASGMTLTMAEAVSAYRWSDGTGTHHDLGERCFSSIAEARRGWEFARRAVWAAEFRFRVPRPATLFDGVTADAVSAACDQWNHVTYDLAAALEALKVDRQRLRRFRKQPAATAITDFLDLLSADLDEVEATARALAAVPPGEWREHPSHLSSARKYGHGDENEVTE